MDTGQAGRLSYQHRLKNRMNKMKIPIQFLAATLNLPSIGRTDVPSVIIMSGEDA